MCVWWWSMCVAVPSVRSKTDRERADSNSQSEKLDTVIFDGNGYIRRNQLIANYFTFFHYYSIAS